MASDDDRNYFLSFQTTTITIITTGTAIPASNSSIGIPGGVVVDVVVVVVVVDVIVVVDVVVVVGVVDG